VIRFGHARILVATCVTSDRRRGADATTRRPLACTVWAVVAAWRRPDSHHRPFHHHRAMKLLLRLTACAFTILLVSSVAALAWDRSDPAPAVQTPER